jgi:hypothetical protein
MAASIATTSSPKVGSGELVPRSVSKSEGAIVTVTFAERGKTDKYGWMNSFDDLADYLGRLS